MLYRKQGFTIVEVIIVVVVVGILAGLATFAFVQVQANVRNGERAADMNIIADGLERYYQKNGAYPSCTAMTQTASSVATLLDIPTNTLTAPTATSGTNSIAGCSLLTGSGADVYAYIGDPTAACVANEFCYEYTLQYRQEGGSTIISKESDRCGETRSTSATYAEVQCYRPAS